MNTNDKKIDYCRDIAGTTETTCEKVLSQIATTKNQVAREFAPQVAGHESVLRLALNEAEALAWETNYPHLVFATLAMEKAQAAATWETRQQLLSAKHQ